MKSIPQPNKDGISQDYNNELSKLYNPLSVLDSFDDEPREVLGLEEDEYLLKNVSFKTYFECFPLKKYDHKNQEKAERLNQKSREVKNLLEEETQDFEKLSELIIKIHEEITGKELPKPIED